MRASELSRRLAISGSYPCFGTPSVNVRRIYSRIRICASSVGMFCASGQPPRQVMSNSFRVSLSAFDGSNLPSNNPARLTAPVESPLSHRLIGFMRMRPIRPAPVCCGRVSFCGVEEPVSSHWPLLPGSSSTLWRISSQIAGAIAHSSMTCGRSPSSISDGSACAMGRLLSRST